MLTVETSPVILLYVSSGNISMPDRNVKHFLEAAMKDHVFCPQCGKRLAVRNVGGKERPSCPSDGCGYVFWNNPLPVVTAIVEHEGGIVLSRNREWPEKVFGLNTGFLEKDETPEEGIAREIKEELGLDAAVVGFIGLFPFFPANQLLIAYHVCATGTITLGDEIAETRHVLPGALRPWNFGTGLVVKAWLEKNAQPGA